jgi:hypothetical protein
MKKIIVFVLFLSAGALLYSQTTGFPWSEGQTVTATSLNNAFTARVTYTSGPLLKYGVMLGNGYGDSQTLNNYGLSSYVLTSNGPGVPPYWAPGGGGSFTYPGAGIPNSSGSAWLPSYATTGTGNVVLSNGGTLVAPALGMPASGDITNLTGTCAACNISGNAATTTLAAEATATAGGTTNTISYQTAPGVTAYITAPVSSSTFLEWNGTSFIWGTSPGGFTNPMTTAGDLIYGGASGTPTRLPTGSGVLVGGTTPSYSLNVPGLTAGYATLAATAVNVYGGSVSTNSVTLTSGRAGTFTCTSGGSITITNTNILSTSNVIISTNTPGGTVSWTPNIKTITSATSFVVICATSDTSIYNYVILN